MLRRVFQTDGLGEVNDLELFVEFRLILFLFREGLLILRRLWLLEGSELHSFNRLRIASLGRGEKTLLLNQPENAEVENECEDQKGAHLRNPDDDASSHFMKTQCPPECCGVFHFHIYVQLPYYSNRKSQRIDPQSSH